MFDTVEAFYRPGSVREALRLLHSGNGQARIVAGGTDMALENSSSIRYLIDVSQAGLSYIRRKDGALLIGATTTMADLEASAAIHSLARGILARAAATCGSLQIRNTATLGGNMANGSPAADMATPLLALDADAVVQSLRSRRQMLLADYLAAPPRASLLTEIVIPDPPGRARYGWSFQKLGRTAVDISLVNVAAGLQLDTKGRVKWARIALGAVAPVPFRATSAEELMTGKTFDSNLVWQAAEEAARETNPIADVRASAEYRREMSAVLVRRALEDCAAQAGWHL